MVHSSTSLILQSIQSQKRASDLVLMKPRLPLPPPTDLRESEKLFSTISRAFTFITPGSISRVNDALDFGGSLNFGCHYIARKQVDLGIPLLEKGFRSLEDTLRYNRDYAIIQIVYALYFCLLENQIDLYRLLSRHFYELSRVMFGFTHPITAMTSMLSSVDNSILYKSGKKMFYRAFELLYEDAVKMYGVHENVVAIEALFRAVLASSENSGRGGENTYIWNNQLIEQAQALSNPSHYIASKRIYSLYLRGRGDHQESRAVLEELYDLLPELPNLSLKAQSAIIRACTRLGHEYKGLAEASVNISDPLPQSYLVRSREIFEITADAALQVLGPQHADTVQTVWSLAEFNDQHGAILKAQAEKEFVFNQLKEFKLSSEDKGQIDSR